MTCTIISTGEELLADNKNEYEAPHLRIKAELHILIGGLYMQGYNSFYCSCEYGIPLWAAGIIGSLKQFHDNIQLHIVTPYEEQAVQWTEEHRDRWFRVHERADSVILATTQYHPDCYSEAGKRIICRMLLNMRKLRELRFSVLLCCELKRNCASLFISYKSSKNCFQTFLCTTRL